MDLPRGPLSDNAGVAEASLRTLQHLAINDDDYNIHFLGFSGACKGNRLSSFSTDLLVDLHFYPTVLLVSAWLWLHDFMLLLQ